MGILAGVIGARCLWIGLGLAVFAALGSELALGQPREGASYMILSHPGGRAVQVADAEERDLAKIELYQEFGAAHQCWRFKADPFDGTYSIFSLKSGKVLDVMGYSRENGADIQLFNYFGTRNQRWRLLPESAGVYQIISLLSGKCMTAAESADHAGLTQNACGASPAQAWRLHEFSESKTVYRIVCKASGKTVEVADMSRQDGGNVQQVDAGEGQGQLWSLCPNGTVQGKTAYAVVSFHSGKVLDVKSGGREDGTNIQQHAYNGGDNQRWMLIPAEPSVFQFMAVHSGKCMDVKGESRKSGANIQQHACNGGDNQLWRLMPVRDL